MADNENTSVTKDLGIVSAYGYAKAAGYTGTEEEFEQIFLEFTEDAPGLLDRLDEAVSDCEDAASDAADAKTAAENAQTAAEAAAATFETDTTLAVSGKAADAKVTGDEITGLKTDFYDLRTEKVTGKNILVTRPTRGFSFQFDKSKATFCKQGQQYAYSFESVTNATSWRTTLNVWDVDGNKITETDSTIGEQNAFSVVASRFFATGIQYNDVYYTESGNGTYKSFIFTFNQDCYVMFGIYFGDTSETTIVNNAQLEKGNVVTPYVPYSSKTYLEDVLRIDSILDEAGEDIWSDTETTTQTGKYIPSTGIITDIGAENYIIKSCSVTENETLQITGQAYKNSYYYAFYGENDSFVSGLQATESGTTSIEDVEITVPPNAKTLAVAASSIVPHIKRKEYAITTVKKWAGKKWSAIGDSLTEVNEKTSKNYCDYISEKTGIVVNNMGLSGSGYMRKHDTNQAFYDRVASVPTDSDVVTIFGSLNDANNELNLGTVDDDVSDNTVFGYVNGTIDALYTAFPTVNLGIIAPTPWKSSEPWNDENNSTKYCDGLKQICYNRGIPFLDLYHCSNLRPWDATARDLFYSHDVVDGVNAGCHPDEAGHKMFATKVKSFIEMLLL